MRIENTVANRTFDRLSFSNLFFIISPISFYRKKTGQVVLSGRDILSDGLNRNIYYMLKLNNNFINNDTFLSYLCGLFNLVTRLHFVSVTVVFKNVDWPILRCQVVFLNMGVTLIV